MRSLLRRLRALESRRGAGTCPHPPAIVWRERYPGDPETEEPPPVCEVCGLPKEVGVIRYVDEWRTD